MKKIELFTLHNDRNESVFDSEILNWRSYYPSDNIDIFGPITSYSWFVDGITYQEQKLPNQSWQLLPDASGFICFESDWKPDNCILLDVFGKERKRLMVPWQITKQMNPESAVAPTSFCNISKPYTNPINGNHGVFGVTAWVEHAGKYYFELDYRSAQFLWGKEIGE